ncbi:testis anion transporter 1 isoform X5 [Grus americana]|uniref:testis anion transporter 1 isoform X5 n=1 Tax=Grus americana TaxID=9117 RepID=UPI0024086D1E|nr:testis anion transporter 1 isoform X5 [Grus americana]
MPKTQVIKCCRLSMFWSGALGVFTSLTAKKLWSPAFGVPLFLTDCDQKENTALDNDTVGNYKQPSAYRVQREMQTEEHFQAYFERKLSSTLGGALQIPRENRRLQCSFSWGRFRKITLKVFPVLNWLFSYRFREWILRDLHAGLSVGMVQIPQGLLGVWLTRLPVPNINGFLSAFCCSMTYVIFGTSHHISVGSFSILNVVGTNILKTLNFNQTLSSNGSLENFSDSTFMKDYVEVLTLTASITFLTGIIQLLLGCFCLGFVTTYVPKTLIDAYLTAAALHVIVSQFTFIFDIMLDFHKGPLGIFYNLFHFFLALPKANATSILLFLLSMAALRVNTSIMITYKHSPIAFPMELLLIITVTIISNRIHLHAESSSAVVSMIPQRFLPPTPPDLSNLSKIILHAFSLAIVSYFLLVFVGERYASPHNYHIASNQELIAVGLCNICSSFFKSFVVSCAISGTVIQEKTGGRTQLAAAIGASLMLVIALKLGHFFQMIPNGMLAAIVVFNVLPFLEKFLDIPILWRRDKYHFVIWLVTFAAVLCLGLEVGLAIAVGFTFFIITIRSHRMKMVVLGQIPNMNIYRSLSIYRAAREIEGIKIFQCCSSISFANVNHFKTYLLHEMDVKAVPLAESEVRAFVSFSLSDTSVERKDLKCSCVCDPPLPPPRIPYTEKLVKQHHADSDSSSSSVNLVHWSKYGDKLSSRTFLVGAANASSGFNTGLTTEKKEGERRRGCLSPISPIDNSSVQLDQEEQPMHLPCPVHTIILDFSMVQFVDLIGSELMRQIIHMFQNIGITVLIAGCHSSVIADFEKNDFFDSCVTKERFFLTLHDAVLAALDKHQKPDEVELTAKESAEEPPAEQQKGGSLLLKKNKDFFSAKTSDNKLLREEPISDTSFSAQNKAEPSSLQQYDAPPLQMDFQDPGWGKRWKYTSKS